MTRAQRKKAWETRAGARVAASFDEMEALFRAGETFSAIGARYGVKIRTNVYIPSQPPSGYNGIRPRLDFWRDYRDAWPTASG